ncbi:uncharacterized protein LOC110845145 [Folsomia candida]|nr:uncharacterized protein LOC110845145 [Folsomia candida]
MCRILLLSIFAIISISVGFSIHDNDLDTDLEQTKIGIPTEMLLEALESQFNNPAAQAQGRGANFFNLSAYLNTNRPNGTALTFVPLITLILGKLNLGTVG